MLFTEVLTYAWFDIGTIPSFNGLRKILIMDLNVCRMEKSLNMYNDGDNDRFSYWMLGQRNKSRLKNLLDRKSPKVGYHQKLL